MAEFIKLTPEEQQKLNDLVEKQTAALEKQVEYQSKLERLRGNEVTSAQQSIDLLADRNRQAQEFLDILSQQFDSLETLERSQKRIIENLEEESRRGRLNQENFRTQADILNTIFDTKKKLLTADEEEGKQLLAILAALEQRLKKEQQITAERIKGVDTGKSLIDNATGLLGLTNKTNSATSKFVKSLADGKEGFKGIGEGAAKSLLEVVSLENLLANVVEDIIVLGVEFDQIQSSFAAVSGRGRELAGVVVELQSDLGKLGITQGELGASLLSLENDFVKFTTLTEDQTKSVIELTSKLQKLGVGANDTTDNFNFLMSSMAMGFEESQQAIEKLTLTAAELNIPFDDMNSSFNALSPRLLLFGNRGVDIFNRTAAAAKKLGLSVSELGQNLFAIGEGFDEFDEAASKVAALNLTLGGSFLNTYEIVMAAAEGPFEQVKLLQQAFQDAGKSFSDMGFREKQFLSKSIGVDVQTLGTILSDATLTQEEFNQKTMTIDDVVQKAVPALDKLAGILQQVVTSLGPVIETFASMMQFLADTFGKAFGPIMIGLVTAGTAVFLYSLHQTRKAVMDTATATGQLAEAFIRNSQATRQAAGAQMELPGTLTQSSEAIKQQTRDIDDNTNSKNNNNKQTNNSVNANAAAASSIGKVTSALASLAGGYYMASSAAGLFVSGLESLGVASDKAKMIIGGLLTVIGSFIAFKLYSGLATSMAEGAIAGGPIGAALGSGAFLTAVGAAFAGMATFAGAFSDDAPSTGLSGSSPSLSAAATAQGFNMSSPEVQPGVNDAVIQEQGGKTKITPINSRDQLIAAKPGGPVQQTMQQAEGQMTGGVPMRLVTALEKMVSMLEASSRTEKKQPINVTVELDKRKMGKAVTDLVNKELALVQ